MTNNQDAVRRLLRPVLAAALMAVVLGSGCELIGPVPGFHLALLNSGRDPIHVGSVKCLQNKNTFFAALGESGEETKDYPLSRSDINLGVLRVTAQKFHPDNDIREVTITMTEPVYFDFGFESSSYKVSVTYIKP